ncbi:tetratricopeptide repeat protein [Roseiflexus castenholzii]|uniref:tetratricopeptide repeat protein n=1 Tax=Roseiflexus castenholzii TaxID=120962 RepID=UPI003C7E6AAE
MSDTPRNPLSPAAVRSLLNAAARLRQQGDIRRARILLRALAAQHPNNPWVWRALADVAENEQERRAALRRIVALVRSTATPGAAPAEPSSTMAQPPPPASSSASVASMPATQPGAAPRDLATAPTASLPPSPPALPSSPGAPRITPPAPASLSTASAGASSAPAEQTIPPQPTPTAPLSLSRYNWIGIAAIGASLLIVAALLTNARFPGEAIRPTSTLILATPEPVGGSASSTPSPNLPASSLTTVPATPAALRELPIATIAPTGAPSPPATPTPLPSSTPLPTLPVGTVILRDAWTLTLLRPDHTLVLNGAIGSRQPDGRFVLALVAVGNGGDAAIPAPPELFVLIDDQGNRYLPEPALSTLYLETFGRGRYGDFSLDEAIPPRIGQVSVPVIFDVPVGARGLTLHLGDSVAGWPVLGLP